MIGLVVIGSGRPRRVLWRRRPRVDLRTLAKAIASLQVAEGMALHARRDGCTVHGFLARATQRACEPVIPRKLARDAEWVHRHIEAPGMRIQARVDERSAQ